MNNRRKLLIVVCASSTMTTAVATEYPARPVRLIVPFPPGGVRALMAATDGAVEEIGAWLQQQPAR